MSTTSTRLDFRHCVLNGRDKCQRMVSFQGAHPVINAESCYVHDMFSFVTVLSPADVTRGVLTLVNCVLYDLQDGVKVVVHHTSSVAVHVVGCQFEIRQERKLQCLL